MVEQRGVAQAVSLLTAGSILLGANGIGEGGPSVPPVPSQALTAGHGDGSTGE